MNKKLRLRPQIRPYLSITISPHPLIQDSDNPHFAVESIDSGNSRWITFLVIIVSWDFVVVYMSRGFTPLSWLSWRGKHQQSKVANGSSSSTTQDPGLWDLDTVKFPLTNGTNIGSSSRSVKKKWINREERKVDKDYDIVLVPHDGGCVSGTESDDSDWSIGWSEPHGPEFHDDDDEINNSFAVLVPCYGRGVHKIADRPQIKILGLTGNFSDDLPADMEQWLSSLHND